MRSETANSPIQRISESPSLAEDDISLYHLSIVFLRVWLETSEDFGKTCTKFDLIERKSWLNDIIKSLDLDASRKPTLGTVAREAGGIDTHRKPGSARHRPHLGANPPEGSRGGATIALRSQLARRRDPVRGQSRDRGLFSTGSGNPFNAEVIGGVVDLLEAEGYLVSVVDTRDDPTRQARQLEAFIRHGRGGLLWVPAIGTPDETFEMLDAQRIPTVTFLRQMHRDLDHVGIRNAEATSTATGYLADLGHRHIAYLGGTDMTVVRRERIEGYEREISERGLTTGVVWDCEDNKLAGSGGNAGTVSHESCDYWRGVAMAISLHWAPAWRSQGWV